MTIQPKPYMDAIKLRRISYGTERRRNMSKIVLEKGTPLPKPIEYSDIDNAFFDWVDKKIEVVYDGVRLPTYKLFSTQRISEYAQTWQNLDDTGNIVMNFKTVTRETNPNKGDINGNYFNIPGHKDFAMFYVPVLQENGSEAYDKYTIKQPFGVNFIYSVSIITNKMEVLNEMNEAMLYEFNAINVYIAPNGHPMSMTLDDISDDSEYAIDDRKYYSQTYKIKVRGYIIRKEDFKVERVPSRLVLSTHDSDAVGIVNRRKKNRRLDEQTEFFKDSHSREKLVDFFMENAECEVPIVDDKERPGDVWEEEDADDCCDKKDDGFYHKTIKVFVRLDTCSSEITFTFDKDMVIEQFETENVNCFDIYINGEKMSFDGDFSFENGDEITVKVTRTDENKDAIVTIVGYDPNEVIENKVPESVLDEVPDEEDIYVNPKEEE